MEIFGMMIKFEKIFQCKCECLAMSVLLQELGHRVRLATHANFEQFVLDAGVEFYPLGGDPKVLAECMKTSLFLTSKQV